MALATGSMFRNRYRIEQLLGAVEWARCIARMIPGCNRPSPSKRTLLRYLAFRRLIESTRQQFEQEALVLARAPPRPAGRGDHFGTRDGSQYLVMDFIEGEDLAQIIARTGPYPEAQSRRLDRPGVQCPRVFASPDSTHYSS